ncbi:Metal transporter CNNM2 [Eumeta japonica]|uniref:Metal transporter CNNM2 n=1 Tax=Eumeta variegata TaxID=151549 RepID=A0A4C1V2F6_EUMVA|nr:Metal transporter CNNM2 [Eumeta japonica]
MPHFKLTELTVLVSRDEAVGQYVAEKNETQSHTTESEEENSQQNLQTNTEKWLDLSHDIDVNYLPDHARPTRDEQKDIETFQSNLFIPLDTNEELQLHNRNDVRVRKKRSRSQGYESRASNWTGPTRLYTTVTSPKPREIAPIKLRIQGLRVEESDKEPKVVEGGIPSVLADTKMTLRLFGEGLTDRTVIAFTHDILDYDQPCKFMVKGEYMVGNSSAVVSITVTNFVTVASPPVNDKNIDDVRRMIKTDRHVTYYKIRVSLGIGMSQIQSILHKHSAKKKLCSRWIPHNFTEAQKKNPCHLVQCHAYQIQAKEGSVTADTALFEVIAPPSHEEHKLYVCAKNLRPGVADPKQDQEKFYHQGTEPWKVLETHNKLLPLWVSLILILICLMFSALFSGLNLGLMSLDKTELKIISNTGTEKERKYARAIMPVRDHGNYLLCSILLGNVAVNSTFTILLDELTSGLFAVIFSTLAIVLLGEITPQAICSRHGLMVGAKSIMVTKAVMALTAPLAYPVSKLLDYFLGEEIGSVFNRERLKELVKVTTGVNDLDKDEVNIISGALELRKKTVCDVMTKLEDVFMLPINSILDFETMSEIIKSGYSRIPVYEGDRKTIVTVLFIKDLAFVDPDDNTPLRTLCQYYQNPCNFVFEDVTLDVMFRQFKEGHKGHMAFVHRINNEGEGDPFYETIGLVTLEDVIEELIQAEIVDETDVFLDNRTKRRRNRPQNKLQDFTAFAERHENQRIHISPQLTLATFQFLSSSVEAFRPDVVSETVLRRLLKQDVIHHIKLKGKDRKDPSIYVFQQGKPVDYFVLILEGRVEVTVGRENLVFEAGPFTYFGVQALTQNIGVAESPTPSAMGSLQNINMDAMLRHTFVPDYSVRAVTQLYYLTVKRSLYLAAKRATLMEKGALSKGGTAEQFDTEVDKLLQSVDEDMSISGDHKSPSRQVCTVSPNLPPLPTSASPHTRASFAASAPAVLSPERRGNGGVHPDGSKEEQERLLRSE